MRRKGVMAHSMAHKVEATAPAFASLTRKDFISPLALQPVVKDTAEPVVVVVQSLRA